MSSRLEIELDKVDAPIFVLPDGRYQINKVEQNDLNSLALEKGRSYILRFIDTTVSTDLMRVTSDNWNKARYITSRYLHCEVIQVMGQMIQINGVGYDFDLKKDIEDIYYMYWVHRNCVEIVEILH